MKKERGNVSEGQWGKEQGVMNKEVERSRKQLVIKKETQINGQRIYELKRGGRKIVKQVRERERERERGREKRGCIVVYCIVLFFLQCGPCILGKPIYINIVKPMQYPMRIARACS